MKENSDELNIYTKEKENCDFINITSLEISSILNKEPGNYLKEIFKDIEKRTRIYKSNR